MDGCIRPRPIHSIIAAEFVLPAFARTRLQRYSSRPNALFEPESIDL